MYQDARDDTWKVHAFSGEQIRDNSPLYNQSAGDFKIHNGFLLTTEVNAFRILTAIDLLKTLGDNRIRPELDIMYTIAKTTLKHLVPKLR